MERDENKANMNEIWHLFRLINSQQKPHYYLIDGFDECEKQEEKYALIDAKTIFLTQMNESISAYKARVMIVSRPDAEIRDQLQLHREEAEMEGLSWNDYEITLLDTEVDLSRFAAGTMGTRLANRDTELRHELAEIATVKADGMFLWIKLMYGQLSNYKSGPTLRKIIADTPSRLDQTYERELKYILDLNLEERKWVMAILRWTLFSFRSLTLKQPAEALLVEFDEEEADSQNFEIRRGNDTLGKSDSSESQSDDGGGKYLPLSELPDFGNDDSIAYEYLKNCGSLLKLRGSSSKSEDLTIHFVHFSVQEYLSKIDKPGKLDLQDAELPDSFHGHEKTSHICLKYLLHDGFRQDRSSTKEQLDQKMKKYALLRYAGIFGGLHARHCRPLSQTTIDLSNNFLDPNNRKWLSYSEVVGGNANGIFRRLYARFEDRYPNPLHYASLWGIVETMEFLIIGRAEDVNHIGGLYGSPLKAAVANGFGEAVKLLLDKGADINLNSGRLGTAIATTAAEGHIEIAKLLPEHKPGINIQGGWANETPILAATRISSRRISEEMVRLLIEAGADVRATDFTGETAVHGFAAKGATKALMVLIRNDAPLDTEDEDGKTALMRAIEDSRHSVVDLLLSSGTDVNLKDKYGLRALHLACKQPKFIPCLLSHGSEINARDDLGQPALQQVVVGLNVSAVCVLLENEANPNISNKISRTPLHLIASEDTDAFDEGAPVELQDQALIILDLLLIYGADTNLRAELGVTLLHYCAWMSETYQARKLLDPVEDEEPEFCQRWRESMTISESPTRINLAYIMKRLLEYGADRLAKDDDR